MAVPYRVKRSAVAGKAPQLSDMDLGEIAINTHDGKMFIKVDDGQQRIVEVLFGDTTNTSFLLGLYPGAAAAFSLRQLVNGDPFVVRVRRDFDNVERDFKASEIREGYVEDWVGAGDGFVTIWYDQSGNEYNAVQSSASAQPTIVSNGAAVIRGGKPSIDFDGSDDKLSIQSTANDFEAWMVSGVIGRQDWSATSGREDWLQTGEDESTSPLNFEYNSGAVDHYRGAAGGLVLRFDYSVSESALHLITVTQENVSSTQKDLSLHFDGQLQDQDSGNYEAMSISKSAEISDGIYQGAISEIIIYPSAQISNRSAIEQNINDHYGVF